MDSILKLLVNTLNLLSLSEIPPSLKFASHHAIAAYILQDLSLSDADLEDVVTCARDDHAPAVFDHFMKLAQKIEDQMNLLQNEDPDRGVNLAAAIESRHQVLEEALLLLALARTDSLDSTPFMLRHGALFALVHTLRFSPHTLVVGHISREEIRAEQLLIRRHSLLHQVGVTYTGTTPLPLISVHGRLNARQSDTGIERFQRWPQRPLARYDLFLFDRNGDRGQVRTRRIEPDKAGDTCVPALLQKIATPLLLTEVLDHTGQQVACYIRVDLS